MTELIDELLLNVLTASYQLKKASDMDLFLFKYNYLFKTFTLGMDKLVQLGWEYGYLKSHMFTNETLSCTFQPITNTCAVYTA